MGKKNEDKLRGDKLRELILLVYLENKYDKQKMSMAWFKEKAGYHSPGGFYSAIDSSGYFDRKNDEIALTQKGFDYLNREILQHYEVFNPIGNFLIVLGLVFLLQWYSWTYLSTPIVTTWYSAVMTIGIGIAVRVFSMRMVYWIMKHHRSSQAKKTS